MATRRQESDEPVTLSERLRDTEDESFEDDFSKDTERPLPDYQDSPPETSGLRFGERAGVEREFNTLEENEIPLIPADFTPVEFLLCTMEQRSFRKIDSAKNPYMN
jgi:hypothetical protein